MHETYRLSFREFEPSPCDSGDSTPSAPEPRLVRLVIIEKQTDAEVGKAWIRIWAGLEPTAEIGFEVQPEFRDLSFSSEVGLGLLQMAFGKFGVVQAKSTCPTSVDLMRRTFTRLGMALRGFSPTECMYDVRAAEFLVQEICLT